MPLSSQALPRRAFIADTTALIVFFTTTGIINEHFVAGMTWEQVFHARLLLWFPSRVRMGYGAIGSCSALDQAAYRDCFGIALRC
jgi:hypothetical protein